MSYQDWKPVTLSKKKITHHPRAKFVPDEEMLSKAPAKVSFKLSQRLQKARAAKKLTQAQLAQRCNLNVRVVRDYESGVAIPNHAELNKIRRVLGRV